MPELKPCPNVCCKSDPRLLHNKPRAGYVVLCRACGWSASELKERSLDAIDLWNHRPGDAVLEAAQKLADAKRKCDAVPAKDHKTMESMAIRIALSMAVDEMTRLLPPRSAPGIHGKYGNGDHIRDATKKVRAPVQSVEPK